MKSLLLLPVLIAISTAALAEPTCTAAKEKWMAQANFKHVIEAQGYKVKTLKVTNGCYEIYGHDKNGKRVELSFDPVSGTLAK
jgi:hypothetical protein